MPTFKFRPSRMFSPGNKLVTERNSNCVVARKKAKIGKQSRHLIDDRIGELLGLLQSCMSAHDALESIWPVLDENPDGVDDLLKVLELNRAEKEVREQAKVGIATVICAYRQARLDQENDPCTRDVEKILNDIVAAPHVAGRTLKGIIRPEQTRLKHIDPDAAGYARMLIEEAALALLVGRALRFSVVRGSMLPTPVKRLRAEDLHQALLIRRGYGILARNVDGIGGVPLADSVASALIDEFPMQARQIDVLAKLVDQSLFGGSMVQLVRQAATRAREALPDGRVHLRVPGGFALAWGAIELIVGFAPTQSKFKLSLTKGSPYLLLVKGIHDLAYPEEEKVSPAADNVKVTIAAWKAGHPAWLFCDDATLKRENARVAEIQKERRVQPNGPRRAGVAAATKH